MESRLVHELSGNSDAASAEDSDADLPVDKKWIREKAANKKKQRRVHVKEVKFRPGTEEGDYQVKLRNLIRFLTDGDKAKVSLRFRGRELAHQHLGQELVERIKEDLSEYGTVEQEPKMEGRQIVMVLAPVKKR